MIQIGITGGKGGTGKSTVSVLLANKYRKEGKKVVLCDCDVECPNDYLLLGQELKKAKVKFMLNFQSLMKKNVKNVNYALKSVVQMQFFKHHQNIQFFFTSFVRAVVYVGIFVPMEQLRLKKK